MMQQVRQSPINKVAGKKVVMIEDYLSGQRNNYQTGVMSQIDLPTSNVLKLYFEGDVWITLRPSGTEPKIKFYFSVKEQSYESSLRVLKKLKEEFMNTIQGVTT